ncbi:MAG: NAD(P)H-binding protein [Burkholderiaceae bacterium]
MRILVPGGAGFIGRHAVTAMLARNHEVVIGSRHPERAHHRLPVQAHRCELRAVRLEQLLSADAWRPLLGGIDVVVNCVGILRERGAATYEKVHHLAPAALADACIAAGVRRLIHISALGLQQRVTSGFLTSKLCEMAERISREVELGGSEQMTIREYLARLRGKQYGVGVRDAVVIEVPHWLARLSIHGCDLLHATPVFVRPSAIDAARQCSAR